MSLSMISKPTKEQIQKIIEKWPELENYNFHLESFDVKFILS